MMTPETATRPKVLFLCVENSCRSQIAEAYAKSLLSELCDSYSSGSKPSGKVNPKAVASMGRAGYDMNTHTSKPLEQLPTKNFDIAITMGCGDFCPDIKAGHSEDWNIPDPKHMETQDFDQVRDQIRSKVQTLKDLLPKSA